jgi:hypothetical protein
VSGPAFFPVKVVMRRLIMVRYGLWALAIVIGAAATYLAVREFGPWGPAVRPAPVDPGDQEVAWVNTSTADAAWERFVAGVYRAQRLAANGRAESPLEVDDSAAYPVEATTVPEVVVRRRGQTGALRLRWYKTTSDVHSRDWARALTRRDPPPVAVIGGGYSDRALELARALADARAAMPDPSRAPLLLLTTATAVTTRLDEFGTVADEESAPDSLLRIYDGRTFRFCFNNQQMARAVLDFVHRSPELRPEMAPPPATAAAATAGAALGGPWHPPLAWAGAAEVPVPWLLLYYEDDPYSVDLGQRFLGLLRPDGGEPLRHIIGRVRFSAGGYYRPRQEEMVAANGLLAGLGDRPQRTALVLPTGVAPSRRILTALTGLDPLIGRWLVVVTGDSLSFNSVYRDGELTFNSRLIPVPVVFFAHANPVDFDADESGPYPLRPPGGTDDVLANAELVGLLAEAALPSGQGPLERADELAGRLRAGLMPPFRDGPRRRYFRDSGNRADGGEYVVCLMPHFGAGARESAASLSVWHRPTPGEGWQPVVWRDDAPNHGDRPEPAVGRLSNGQR